MARAVFWQMAFGAAATGLLVGCVDSGGAGGGTGGAGMTDSPSRAAGAGREVEAPDIFQTTDTALWDGRPSLGGIWIASPNVKDPERVVMLNASNGKSVTGALFRRERENPGPTLQVSSDAAEALGMLAGQPTQLRVVALRKVEAEPKPVETRSVAAVESPRAAQPDAGKPDAGATAGAGGGAVQTAAIAAAALDAADAGGASPESAVDASVAVEAPKRKTWAERRAEARAQRDAEKAAKAAAAASAAAADGIGVSAVETAPLDARSPEIAADPAPPKKTRRQIRAEQEAAASAAAASTEAQAPAPAPGLTEADAPAPAPASSGRPIQIASFSQEDNAKRAVEALAKVAISAQPVRSERGGKVVWGVVAVGDAELLKKIKAAGFADAYFLN